MAYDGNFIPLLILFPKNEITNKGDLKMYCKHCGKQIDDNSKFCNLCGKSLVEQIEDSVTTAKNNSEISAKKKKFGFIGAMAGLLSSIILFIVLVVFSTTTDYAYAVTEWLHFDIGFTYLCVESVTHLITFVSIILCVALNTVILVKPKLLNAVTSGIYATLIVTFTVCVFDFSNACFLIPSFPLIGVMIFSLILMFIFSANKKNEQ